MSGAERWLFVSNGHGEDHVAAMLASDVRTRRPGLDVVALPLVGTGSAYVAAGVGLLDPRARLPSQGLTMHAPGLLWSDLRAGLVGLTLGQCRTLRRAAAQHVVVVGDVYAHALASLVDAPRSVVQTLVSVRMRVPGRVSLGPRRFMEGIHGFERRLMRGRVLAVYARDVDTAAWLRDRGVPGARWLGNPMMDGVRDGTPIAGLAGRRLVALLPGSREHAFTSALRMLDALTACGAVVGLVAWTHDRLPTPPPGWLRIERSEPGLLAAWRHGDAEVWWLAERFRDVLATAQAALGTTGTAQEQAAGLGLPVVTFEHPPLHGRAFVLNQRRLLGAALRVVPADVGAIAGAVVEALGPGRHRRDAQREGPARMGPAGAVGRIADDLLATVGGAQEAARSPRPGA